MRYRAIQEHDRRYPIRLMCRALAVSAAGYYAWRAGLRVRRAVHNRTLLSEIRVIHRESRETYGSPSIWDALIKQGHGVGEHRVARLMRAEGIRAKTVKKWRATTQSNHRLPVAANTLNRQFTVDAAQPGVGRGPHLRVDHGGLALPGRGPRSVLAPRDRLGDGPPADRGSGRAGPHHGAGEPEPNGRAPAPLGSRQPVCRHEYQQLLTITASPPACESRQLLGQRLCRKLLRDTQARTRVPSALRTREEATQDIFEYIEVFYNRKRRHSTLGYDSPAEYRSEDGGGLTRCPRNWGKVTPFRTAPVQTFSRHATWHGSVG